MVSRCTSWCGLGWHHTCSVLASCLHCGAGLRGPQDTWGSTRSGAGLGVVAGELPRKKNGGLLWAHVFLLGLRRMFAVTVGLGRRGRTEPDGFVQSTGELALVGPNWTTPGTSHRR